MSTGINRREFLALLAGLGAAVVLPTNPSAAEVDAAWDRLLKDPWYFDVNSSGTIIEHGVKEPEVNADVYDVSTDWIKDPKGLIDEVEHREELRSHFESLYEEHVSDHAYELEERVSELESERDDENVDAARELELNGLIAALKAQIDSLNGDARDWKHWVRSEGQAGLQKFKAIIDSWLQSPVNWRGMEWWDRTWSGQGRALAFFQQMDHSLVRQLGVRIVEGEHPGSTYYAAELRGSIEDANEAAAELKLPFRFRTVAD